MSSCSQIKAVDPQAGLICHEITEHYQVDTNTLPDSASVYKTAIVIAIREAKANFERLKKNPEDKTFRFNSNFKNFLSKRTDLKLTFVFQDRTLLQTIAAHEAELSTLSGLQHFVSETLGIQFKGIVDNNPDPLDALHKKEGNCLDIVNLYFGISLLTGNEVHPIDDIGPKGTGHHVLVEQKNIFLDPEDGLLKDPPSPSSIQQMDTLALASLYHYNKAFGPACKKLVGKKQAICQLPHLTHAKNLAPNYFRVLYDWGRIQWIYSDNLMGQKAIQEAHQLNPNYVPAKQAASLLHDNN